MEVDVDPSIRPNSTRSHPVRRDRREKSHHHSSRTTPIAKQARKREKEGLYKLWGHARAKVKKTSAYSLVNSTSTRDISRRNAAARRGGKGSVYSVGWGVGRRRGEEDLWLEKRGGLGWGGRCRAGSGPCLRIAQQGMLSSHSERRLGKEGTPKWEREWEWECVDTWDLVLGGLP